MDENKKDLKPSEEEQKAEEEGTREVNEDELRDEVADKFGLDPDEESEMLDKLVENEKAHHEKLSTAIKQKINWRERAENKASENPKETPGKGNKPEDDDGDADDIEQIVDKKLKERLEERELESLNLTDELKEEVKDFAKVKGISVREAAKLPYIQTRKEEVEKEERLKKATPKRTKRGSSTPNIDPAKPLDPNDYDFDTEEGIKAWKEAKKARARYKAQQS